MKRYILPMFSLIMCSLVLISCSNDNQNDAEKQNTTKEQQSDKSNDANQREEEGKAPEKKKLISVTEDSVEKQENNSSIEFPEGDAQFTIEPNNKDKQLIINPFTGRVHHNVHYVEGNFKLENVDYEFEMILSSENVDFNNPKVLKYTSDTGTEYTSEKAQLYYVEEEEFEDL